MQKLSYIVFFISILVNAQEALHNYGAMQLHNNASVGFHTNLVNNGTLNENKGLVGFYSDNELRTIAGNSVRFFNVDIDAINNLELETTLSITNDLSFISGKVTTPRNNNNVTLEFLNHNIYAGESNATFVDGYASVLSGNEFTFPIGDDNRLRPISLPNNLNTNFKAAYFYQDPNMPFGPFASTNFNTNTKPSILHKISNYEYWDLDGSQETTITLTWDLLSNINELTDNLEKLTVVGWNNASKEWANLGQTNITGNSTTGSLTSSLFIPNDYTIITIGSLTGVEDLESDNIYISPNNDGKNDVLVFHGLHLYNKNTLEIYNRWGQTVYTTTNYKNNWGGVSNNSNTLNATEGLPVGTYYYILKYGNNNLETTKNGWVYITR